MSKDWLSNGFEYKPDLEAYFRRIGYEGSRAPTVETLYQLHWHHVRTIPYEWLDIHITKDKIDLAPDIVEKKLITNGRGGFCYEHNTLFMYVLRAMGYKVKPVTARARWQKPEDFTSGNIHLILIVDVGGRSYACDVGFSSVGAAFPLTFDTEEVQHMPMESRRVVYKDEFYVHQLQFDANWLDVFVFTLHESFPMDWEVGSYYWQNHRAALGAQVLYAVLPGEDANCRHRLLNKELVTRFLDGTTETRVISSEEEYVEVLRSFFKMTIPDGTEINIPNSPW